MISGLESEDALVERPLINQLLTMGWSHIEGDKYEAAATGRDSFRDVVLSDRLRSALRRINLDTNGDEWLDDARLAQVESALLKPASMKLLEINEELTEVLVTGVAVEGLPEWDGGRNQTVRFVDWEHPERNEFLVVNQFRVDEPGGQAHKFVVPDLVLFVNGIPLVVIEAKSPHVTEPSAAAIDQLRRYANRRPHVHDPEGCERLFWTNQFVIATHFDRALVGTITSGPDHFAEWKDPVPLTRDELAVRLGKEVDQVSSQEVLVAGMLTPASLLDIVRNFTLFMSIDSGHRVKAVCRYQQFRAVHRSIERLTTGSTRSVDGEHDRRGGIVWHTQGSGKSLTMVFLVRKMRTLAELRRFKVVIVTDRTDLQHQLSETAALTGETVSTAKSVAKAKELLARSGPGLIFAMIQKYQQDEDGTFPVLNESEDIVVLIDEAHRSQGNDLQANLLHSMPNCARIGFTGTPIIMGDKKQTHEIFGDYIDRYTIRESEADGATVPILYEGRTAKGAVTEGRDLDEVFEDMFAEHTPEQIEAIKKRWATKGNVLEAPKMIEAKARDMLRHYVDTVMPNGFKAQVVATSRLAAVRYRDAFLLARSELVAELEALDDEWKQPGAADRTDGLPQRRARLVRAYPHIELIRQLDFVPVISAEHNDDPAWHIWTDPIRQKFRTAMFKLPLGLPGEKSDPTAFLIVKSMLLTGFDAPNEQVMYLDRSIKEAELLQAIARVNRTTDGKSAGYVVDYFGVAQHLKAALAAYADEDIEGALASIADELPKLADRHERVRQLFTSRGIESLTTESDVDACVELLADERLRAAFEVALKQFLTTLEVVLPRPEAIPFRADAKVFGLIQLRSRRRYRDQDDFDPSLYGEKVRRLIDDHTLALGVSQKIPPVSITAVDFASKVSGLGSTRARASEMEHALRFHIRKHFEEDPDFYGKLSERLEEILTTLSEQWDQLALALGDLVNEATQGRQVDHTGLDPVTEAPFYGLLRKQLESIRRAEPTLTQLSALQTATVSMVEHIRDEVGLVGFWGNVHAQDSLRRWIVQHLDGLQVDGADLFPLSSLAQIADRTVELAKANHSRLIRT